MICVSRARASSLLPRLPLSIPFVHFDGVFVRGALRALERIDDDDDDVILSRTNTPSQIHMHAHITLVTVQSPPPVIHGIDKNLLKQASGRCARVAKIHKVNVMLQCVKRVTHLAINAIDITP